MLGFAPKPKSLVELAKGTGEQEPELLGDAEPLTLDPDVPFSISGEGA